MNNLYAPLRPDAPVDPRGRVNVGSAGDPYKIPAAQQPPRESQFDKVATRMQCCVNDLQVVVNMLCERLVPVLDPQMTSAAKETAPPRPVRSPIVDVMDNHSDAIHSLTLRLRDVVERLAT